MASVFLLVFLQVEALRQAWNPLTIQDKKHVNSRDRLRRQPRLVDPDLSLARITLGIKSQLHVAVARRQAVRVMVTAKDHDRRDLVRPPPDLDVEMAFVVDLIGRFEDDWPGC